MKPEIKPGDTLIIRFGGWLGNSYTDKVARLTKTQIAMSNGDKFNRNTWQEVGSGMKSVIKIASKRDLELRQLEMGLNTAVYYLRKSTDKDKDYITDNIDKIIRLAKDVKELKEGVDGMTK